MSDLQTPPGSPLPPAYPQNPGPYGLQPGPNQYGPYPGYGFPPPQQQKPPNRRGLVIAIAAAVVAVVVAVVLAVVLVSGSSSPTPKAATAMATAPTTATLSPELAQAQTCSLYRSTKQADDAVTEATPIPADWTYATPGVLPLLDSYAKQSMTLQKKLLAGISSETPASVADAVRGYGEAMLARAQNFLQRGDTTKPNADRDRAELLATAQCGAS